MEQGVNALNARSQSTCHIIPMKRCMGRDNDSLGPLKGNGRCESPKEKHPHAACKFVSTLIQEEEPMQWLLLRLGLEDGEESSNRKSYTTGMDGFSTLHQSCAEQP